MCCASFRYKAAVRSGGCGSPVRPCVPGMGLSFRSVFVPAAGCLRRDPVSRVSRGRLPARPGGRFAPARFTRLIARAREAYAGRTSPVRFVECHFRPAAGQSGPANAASSCAHTTTVFRGASLFARIFSKKRTKFSGPSPNDEQRPGSGPDATVRKEPRSGRVRTGRGPVAHRRLRRKPAAPVRQHIRG